MNPPNQEQEPISSTQSVIQQSWGTCDFSDVHSLSLLTTLYLMLYLVSLMVSANLHNTYLFIPPTPFLRTRYISTNDLFTIQDNEHSHFAFPQSREWEYYDGGCYYFGIQKVNWHAAQSHCEEQNSKLVVIHDEPKQNFIQSQTRDERYWIGLSDVNVEGEWKWIDGTDYRTSYKKWRSGEPNVHGDHGEDCAQIHIAGEWNDVQCNYKSFYICEKPLPS
uniref:C-type lectin domain-containing protein n=1 Tax=Varanus komodoensis TaxID=61221 RepID=A0A8D2KWQ0_VARKO